MHKVYSVRIIKIKVQWYKTKIKMLAHLIVMMINQMIDKYLVVVETHKREYQIINLRQRLCKDINKMLLLWSLLMVEMKYLIKLEVVNWVVKIMNKIICGIV